MNRAVRKSPVILATADATVDFAVVKVGEVESVEITTRRQKGRPHFERLTVTPDHARAEYKRLMQMGYRRW